MSTTVQDTSPTGVELEPRPAVSPANPALRGPVLLATDGMGRSGASVIAARLLSERLGVPLEVVTVLEPQALYGGMAIGGVPVFLPEVEDATRKARAADVNDYVARFSGDA